MRKILVLLALAMLAVSTTGCCRGRLRNLFRRGAPCGGTRLAAPAMLGGAVPLGLPAGLRQAIPQGAISQPSIGAPACCEPCPTECCEPCPSDCGSGYMGDGGYIGESGGDCGCQGNTGEYFGGYVGEGAPPVEYGGYEGSYEGTYEGNVVPGGTVSEGSGTYPGPTN